MSEPPGPAPDIPPGEAPDEGPAERLRVLIVSRWLPAYDDPVRGSFVADQVTALAAVGDVEPCVASFEFSHLSRLKERQPKERAALQSRFAGAARARPDAATAGGWLTTSAVWAAAAHVPVARLLVANAPQDPLRAEADDHAAALLPFVEGLIDQWGRPDLLHAHTGFPDGVAAAVVAERLGIPLVITEHASRTPVLLEDPEVRERYVRALERAARVIAVSRTLADEILAALPEAGGWLPGRLEVVPNAVPLELFRPSLPSGRRRDEILYVGSRKPEKGIATLLGAFARAHAARPTITLRLIGPATVDDQSRWTSLTAELGLSESVAFEPAVDRAGVAEAMARADLFVHPSRRETFGVVGVEALASGLPVVATQSGGLGEILGDHPERYGALVAVDDEEALAAAMLGVLGQRDRYDPQLLRQAAETRFASGAVARRLVGLYRDAVARPARAGNDRGFSGDTGAGRGAPRPGGTPEQAADRATSGPFQLPALVVAFNRVQAERALTPLPRELRASLTLMTVVDPGGQALPADLAEVLEVDLDVDFRAAREAVQIPSAPKDLWTRATWRVRDPRPAARERFAAVTARRPEYQLETAGRSIVGALQARAAANPTHAATAPDIVCLGGYDVLAAEPALQAGLARLTPGGLRWLADRWVVSARPVSEDQRRVSRSTSSA